MTETTRPILQAVGKYDLVEKIAEGGMGTVYKARDRETGQVVAIKVAPPHVVKNPVLLKRFEKEFAVASNLEHANIVRALDYGYHGTAPYLVMEYVEGESLGQKLEREGRLAETEAIKIVAQVAQGLHKAHKQGVVHRDVKPDNILLAPDGQAKLADLGLVKEADGDLNLTRTGRGLGTPHFMAPEQFRNAKNADVRCDIYSLAATLYMTLTGELPFKSTGPLDAWMKKVNNDLPPPRQLVPSVSERVDWAVRRAMHPDPTHRPATCREFVEDLTGHSTRKLVAADVGTVQDYWFLVYKDEDGVLHTVKGTLGGIRRSLKEGFLGDASNVRASRTKSGPFEPLRNHPEFRDIVLAPPVTLPNTPPPLPKPQGLSATPPQGHRVATPTPEPDAAPPAPPARPSSVAPLIDIRPTPKGIDWFKWFILLVVFAATGLVSFFYLLPMLTGGKIH